MQNTNASTQETCLITRSLFAPGYVAITSFDDGSTVSHCFNTVQAALDHSLSNGITSFLFNIHDGSLNHVITH